MDIVLVVVLKCMLTTPILPPFLLKKSLLYKDIILNLVKLIEQLLIVVKLMLVEVNMAVLVMQNILMWKELV